MCEIGKKLYNRRKELGLTLEEVGNHVGVGKSTVRKWENGQIKNMGRDKIAKLAKILQISPVELVPGEKASNELTTEETKLIKAYRGAEQSAKEYAMEILINHQIKKDTSDQKVI